MTNCPADLVGDLEEVLEALHKRVDENRQRATRHGDGNQQAGQDTDEFAGLPFLVIPVNNSDSGDRPLPSRPEGPPQIPGRNPGVYDGDGGFVREVSPGETYELRCQVSNEGDLHVSRAVVEFFVDHRPPSVTIDPADERLRLTGAPDQSITGYTTYPPGTRLLVNVGHGDVDAEGRSVGRELEVATVDENRTFSVPIDLSDIPEDRSIFDHPELRINVFSTHLEILARKTIELRETLERIPDSSDKRGPLELDSVTDEVEFVGRTPVRVPSGRSVETSVEYTVPDHENAVQTAVYARVYTMAPIDVPNEWGTLDLRPDRHVGRTEVYWE